MTAPDSEFINWQSILDNCLSTLEFSDTFVNEFNKEESNYDLIKMKYKNEKIPYDKKKEVYYFSYNKNEYDFDIYYSENKLT